MLQAFAPALREYLSGGDDQVKCFAKLQTADLVAAVEASMESIKLQLGTMHSVVKTATEAKSQLQEEVDKDPTNQKFSTRKAAGGTIDDFFHGLEDRIGEQFLYPPPRTFIFDVLWSGAPNLDFKKTMRAEHTTLGGSTFTFKTGNYKITTQPNQEWLYVVGDESGTRLECPDMGHSRHIKTIDDLMKKPLARKAKLTEEEIIAVVLYTGVFQFCTGHFRHFTRRLYSIHAQVPCLSSTMLSSANFQQTFTKSTNKPTTSSPPLFSFS